MNEEFRKEKDVLGEVNVPKDAYWGVSTQRAINNFQISKKRFPSSFLVALAKVKKACLLANHDLNLIEKAKGKAILQAINEIIEEKKYLDQFPVDVFQAGSGTSTHMNMNEVLAHRANEILGHARGKNAPVHPNDHVNRGQSSNDVIPTAMHLSILETLHRNLLPVLRNLITHLQEKIDEFEGIVKVGRTHLQDAVPIPLSMEFKVYKQQLEMSEHRIEEASEELYAIPLGGTAVGTGITAHEDFAERAISHLSNLTEYPFKQNTVKAEGIASHNRVVHVHDVLKQLALALMKMANDIRWMGSGPRAGLGELTLPANELGSSIMPGKINPTQSEALIQVCLQVLGNTTTISFAEPYGSLLDLNVSKPIMIVNVLNSIEMLANSMQSFGKRCLNGLEVEKEEIEAQLKRNLMRVTNLAPVIGYDTAADIAQKAYREKKNLIEVINEMDLENKEKLRTLLDPSKMV
ncbi:MAG: class II fumarate hydratase [Candidatus Korarchaeota archaeon]|nr:class II fumarate hydratase [Candidatus Korarchaeota archaeon]NIU82402.1 aspartate ammonia-lyase [Candidatus Thorarchaeota archaeon]NIW12875.1 aspartate ammonia-lyase [Candidatus Thorarchaeota archaeon]NIW51069.1 aspartate ammonia-lyase [Candidatus Korarchaeota archaeon]